MLYGVEQTVTYVAWDTAANAGKTGDVLNHTLRWVKNGTSSAPTNAASEVDATNAPGVYKLTLTAAEWETYQGTLAGMSSTSGVVIVPSQFTTALNEAQINAQADLALSDVGVTSTRTGYLDATISSRSTLAAGAEMTLTAAYDAAKTASSLTAQQVWEYATRDLTGFGTLVADIATAVWGAVERTITGTVTTDSASREASKADVSTLATAANLALVKAKTDLIPASPAAVGSNMGTVTSVTGAVGSVTNPVVTDTASRTASKADVSLLALEATAQEILAAGGGGTGTAPTVQEIDTELTANHGAGPWTSGGVGSGSTAVTHATLADDGEDMVVSVDGVLSGGVDIIAFASANYDVGLFEVEAFTQSLADGTWREPLMLDPVEHKILFRLAGKVSQVRTVTVGGA